MQEKKIVNYIKNKINNIELYTIQLDIRDLIKISYVAVRNKDNEEGAVQRVLNKKRISSIKQYVLDGHMFINSFILNWNDKKIIPQEVNSTELSIILKDNVAQLIDGQHRLEGIKEATKENSSILDQKVLVSFVIGLKTKEAAEIFININSEQKPVPKSLIFDLYGVTEDDKNFAIVRSDDIAKEINENVESPFYNLIKYPGNPRGKGKIDLSTVVSSIKKYVDVNGKFAENNIKDLGLQSQILINYYTAIKYFWDKESLWDNASQNVFYKASGFFAMNEFFFEYVFPKCIDKKSFKTDTIISLFDFERVDLIKNDDIKKSDGKSARSTIFDNLKDGLRKEAPKEEEYEI